MSQTRLIFASRDEGLLAHWRSAVGNAKSLLIRDFDELARLGLGEGSVVWLDLALLPFAPWEGAHWNLLTQQQKVTFIAADSNPRDEKAIAALGAGCAAYCHAFSASSILRQISKVVQAGHIWIGPSLMQKLIQTAHVAASAVPDPLTDWRALLTKREIEVALLAARGASNLDIARQCQISERTVKAHISAIFQKLHIVDRLQLALKVHGIQ